MKTKDENVNVENCTWCRGCDGCDGCDGCYGCRYSFGLVNCTAVYKSLFSKELLGDKFRLFGNTVTESRIDEVLNKLLGFNWYPKQTNAFELYAACGEEWGKIDPTKLTYKDWNVTWEDCPKEMIAYLQSLPEFDSALFTEITGLKVEDNSEAKQKAKQLREKADELLAQAKSLEESL